MFVETEKRPAGDFPLSRENDSKTLKLSEAIRKGKPLVSRESRISFQLCALGCAWAGVYGREMTHEDVQRILFQNGGPSAMSSFERHLGIHLGFNPNITEQVHEKHCSGIPALQIAEWLESKGL